MCKISSYENTIKTLYDHRTVAETYIDKRFSRPLGAVQHQIQLETLNDAIKDYNANRVLEIACGPARLTAEITGFHTGIAIDNSPEMLSIAQRRLPSGHRWHFLNADAFTFRAEEPFDLVYSFRFIRHFIRNDRNRLYDNVRHLLRTGGIFIFDAVHYDKPRFIKYFENKGDVHIYDEIYPTPHKLIDELNIAGFELLQLRRLIQHFYIQAIISRIAHVLRLNKVGETLIRTIERLNYGRSLEWIAICKKK